MSDDLNGTFIDIEIDESIQDDPAIAAKLAEVCPVDIYAAVDGRVKVVRENLDECVLCYLCLKAAPEGTIKVIKRYED